MKKSLFILIFICFIFISCSKKGMTPAKVKIKVSGLHTFSSAIGKGGGILFGRSQNGELIGQVIVDNEQDFELTNGDWNFYAFMWDSASDPATAPMNENIYCGKMNQRLNGTAISINMSLTNANCSDPEYSNGRTFVESSKVRFANIFFEECDELNAGTDFTCGLLNQGSALSYRVNFKSFKKISNGPLILGGPSLTSACQIVDKASSTDLFHKGLPVNFPSGNGVTPFIVGVEMFLGNTTCDTNDVKGFHSITFPQGFGVEIPGGEDKLLTSANTCSFNAGFFSGTLLEKRNKCFDYLGIMSAGNCLFGTLPQTITRFTPGGTCPTGLTGGDSAIKHLVSIPKSFICDRYLGQSTSIGTHPFSGGDGSLERAYKICTEWQMNQVGDPDAPSTYLTKAYKLMNDLDMNKTDFVGTYTKPTCVGTAGSLVKVHHNLNPLDKISASSATCSSLGTPGFTGTFNGNLKTISHARILAETVDELGLVRRMDGGEIKNLNFYNLEVSGEDFVGGLVGISSISTDNEISDVSINIAKISGKNSNGTGGTYIGGAIGKMLGPSTILSNVQIDNGKIKGRDFLAGLVAENSGTIAESHFSGRISDTQVSGTFVGGLVAQNLTLSSNINTSFSEGVIDTYFMNSGGIAGLNQGTVTNVYSTMIVKSHSPNASVKVGGIVADSAAGSTISHVLFDGDVAYDGGGASSNVSTIYGGALSAASVCYSTDGSPDNGCSNLSYSALRDAISPIFTGNESHWQKLSGSIPRMIFETRECLDSNNQATITAQVLASKGSAANPIAICNYNQLITLTGRSAGEYYKILENINISPMTTGAFITTFNGDLDGDGNSLYGLNQTMIDDSNDYVGIFKTVSSTGKINNLKLFGNKIMNSADYGDLGTGLLVGLNQGEITNIEMRGNILEGYDHIGMVAGLNEGIISEINIQEGSLTGFSNVGGVTGHSSLNTSEVKKAEVQLDIKNFGSVDLFQKIGGIVGDNEGTIDQTRFSGSILLSILSTDPTGVKVGGIAGHNDYDITNSYTDNYSKISGPNYKRIGGLVGENGSSGNIDYSFALGKVIYDASYSIATVSMPFHSLVGLNSGGIIGANVFYLENSIGSLLNIGSTSSACPATSAGCSLTSLSPSILDTNVNLLMSSYNSGNLNSYLPVAYNTSTSYDNLSTTINIPTSTSVSLYKSYSLSYTTGEKAIADFGDFPLFCASWSGALGVEECSNGFDIAGKLSAGNKYGEDRVNDYYQAIMDGASVPVNSPIWQFGENDSYPSLLQLNRLP